MTTQATCPINVRRLLPGVVIAVALLVAACGGASGASSAATASAAAAAAAASPASAGPTPFAAWIEHQGFGASVGPNEVRRTALYISDHDGIEDLFNIDEDLALVTGIIEWLDTHPATACWADYHSQVRGYIATVRDGWTKARPIVANGGLVPQDVVKSALEASTAANDLPAPANCP